MKKTNDQKVYEYVYRVYGDDPFTTEQIYNLADVIGDNPASIGAALNSLKKEGLLINYGERKTENSHHLPLDEEYTQQFEPLAKELAKGLMYYLQP